MKEVDLAKMKEVGLARIKEDGLAKIKEVGLAKIKEVMRVLLQHNRSYNATDQKGVYLSVQCKQGTSLERVCRSAPHWAQFSLQSS